MPLLRSLYFVDEAAFSSEVNQASRFATGRVQEIVIDCLFDVDVGDDESANGVNFALESARPSAFVDFIAALPNVKHVFFGSRKRESKIAILERLQLDPVSEGYRFRFRMRRKRAVLFCRPKQETMLPAFANLLLAIINAYRFDRLSQQVLMYGLPSPQTINVYDWRKTHVRQPVRDQIYYGICQCFPMEQAREVLLGSSRVASDYFPNAPFRYTIDIDKALGMILQRPGGKEVLEATNPCHLLNLLREFNTQRQTEHDDAVGISYRQDIVESLKILISDVKIDPSGLDKQEISDLYANNANSYYLKDPPYNIRESHYKLLKEYGFPLERRYFRAIPDNKFIDTISM
jgi:hypothetical protein